jgi:hypothetical protein
MSKQTTNSMGKKIRFCRFRIREDIWWTHYRLNWSLVGEILLIFISIIDGILLIAMGLANDIWVAYIGYLLYRPLFQMLITIASFEIARYGNTGCGVSLSGLQNPIYFCYVFHYRILWYILKLNDGEPTKCGPIFTK